MSLFCSPGLLGFPPKTYKVLVWKLKERDHLEDLCVDGRIILKYTLRNRTAERKMD
jgi:hypothetical protein